MGMSPTHVRERPALSRGRRLAVAVAVTFAAVVTVWLGAGPSWGAEGCVRSVDAADAVNAGAAEVALLVAFGDAELSGSAGCTSWRVELTGAFELTETIVWIRGVPLTVIGPSGSTARLEAVPAAPATFVEHRILDVDTWPTEVVVTLERLVLTGGNVTTGVMGDDEGGAVLADILHLTDVELIGNHAVAGGAVSVADLRAVRTSFVGNTAESGVGQGGAVNASVSIVLENVTMRANLAKLGGAVHMGLITGTTEGAFDATFVTLLDNEASETTGGADLHLSAATGVGLPIVLRGVLLGGVGEGSDGPSCAGTRFTTPVPGLTWDTSFVTDTSCDAPAGSVITPPPFTTVPFLTGTTDLRVPEGDWEGLDAVECDATTPDSPVWPAVDQRSLTRPQGETGRCDAGAVEREQVAATTDPTPDDPPTDSVPGPSDDSTADATGPVQSGPIPSSIPAGGGGCVDGCPELSERRSAAQAVTPRWPSGTPASHPQCLTGSEAGLSLSVQHGACWTLDHGPWAGGC